MRTIFLVLAVLSLVSFFGYNQLMKDFRYQGKIIFYNGTIYTIEDDQTEVEAVFVDKGVIQAVGNKEDILKLKTSKTQLVDLDGKTMMPGFIDPHTHMALSSFLNPMVDLSGFTHQSEQSVWDHLKASSVFFEKGEWIICKGLDPVLVEGLKSPHISFLDEIAPANPVVILSQSLHTYWANTLAFEAVGIDKNTPDPSVSSYYEKDSTGNLTGLIAEQVAFQPFAGAILNSLNSNALIQASVDVMKAYAKRGNTTIVSAGISIQDNKPLRLYEHLSGGTPGFVNQALSVFGMLPKREANPRHFIYMRHDRTDLLPESPLNGDDFYRVIGVKHWYDGSPYTGSMYLYEPYDTSELTLKGLHIPPGYKGKALIEREDLIAWVKKYQDQGWQISVHTQGDIAIEEVLDVFEEIDAGGHEVNPYRHRLEHCLLMPQDAQLKMKALNMTPSFHINHLYYYGKALKNDLIGEKRAEKILPLGSAQKSGLKISLHADQPMFESHPFRLIQTAVERQTKEGLVLGHSESIDLTAAIKALTINAAWQIHMENKIGSIKKGKYADLIILDADPFNLPVSDLEEIEVLATYVHGNKVNY